MSRGGLAGLGVTALMLFAGAPPAAGAPAVQPTGTPGCVDTEGSSGCAAAGSLAGLAPDQMVVSPNGRYVYGWQQELLFSRGAPHARLLVFARDPRSGALHPLPGRRGCFENAPGPVARQRGSCERVGGLEQPVSLVISPDGRRLYASGRGGHGAGGSYLVTFSVDPRKGALRWLQCLTDRVHSRCAFAPIPSEGHLLVASDSRSVYVSDAFRGAIDVYHVDARGLVLQQCLVGSPRPGCTVAPLLPLGVHGLAETPDGSELYAGGPMGQGAERIIGLGRDQASGVLAPRSGQGDCVSDEPGPPAGCTAVTLTGSALSLSVSGDTLYAASIDDYAGPGLAVAALRRDPGSGALSEPAGAAGCVVFAAAASRGCGAAPRWTADFPYTLPAASGGLLASAVEHQHHVGTVVQVSGSPTGGGLVVNDLRECRPGTCHRLRGAYGELIGPIASSRDGHSVYVAQGDGIAQLRIRLP
jgi:hypothetical protein